MVLDRAQALTAAFEPITLEALTAQASLRTRFDRKYVMSSDAFEALCAQLADSHVVLEAVGQRVFTYDTVYFDTSSLAMYRDHVQRRRRRYKCRARRYVETEHHTFEVKLKGARGMTIKHVMPYDSASHGTIDEQARAFMEDCLRSAYGRGMPAELRPTLRTTYRRFTLALRDAPERLTCDFDFVAEDPGGEAGRLGSGVLASDRVIVEHKSDGRASRTHRALRQLGARPVECSKYCVGIALTRPEMPNNDFRRLLRNHFHRLGAEEPCPSPAPPEPAVPRIPVPVVPTREPELARVRALAQKYRRRAERRARIIRCQWVGAVVLVAGLTVATGQAMTASHDRDAAQRRHLVALSRVVAMDVDHEVALQHAERAVLLSALAYRLDRQAGSTIAAEVDHGLRAALGQPRFSPAPTWQRLSGVLAVADAPGGRSVAVGRADGTIGLWSVRRPQRPFTVLRGDQRAVLSLAYRPDRGTLASGDAAGVVRIWDLRRPSAGPRVLRTGNAGIMSLAYTPDGRSLAWTTAAGVTTQVDLRDARVTVWSLARVDRPPLWLQGSAGVGKSAGPVGSIAPSELAAEACRVVSRDLTRAEWARFVGRDLPYQPVCPKLPVRS
jgi:VTC domain-containing protein/WD40 domain-containing protein